MSATPTDRTLVVRDGQATGYWFLNDYVEMLVTGAESEGRYTQFEVHAPPGDQPPLHLHREADEALHVMSGELEVWAGPMHTTLSPGDYVLLPKGVPHCYLVTSSEPAHFVVTVSPAGFDQFVSGISRPAAEARIPDPPPPPTADDIERMNALMAEIDLELLGPPGARP